MEVNKLGGLRFNRIYNIFSGQSNRTHKYALVSRQTRLNKFVTGPQDRSVAVHFIHGHPYFAPRSWAISDGGNANEINSPRAKSVAETANAVKFKISFWWSDLSDTKQFKRPYAPGSRWVLRAARELAELAELADKPRPAREAVIANAISKAELILRKIDSLYPPPQSSSFSSSLRRSQSTVQDGHDQPTEKHHSEHYTQETARQNFWAIAPHFETPK
jgi:hypothetical protein